MVLQDDTNGRIDCLGPWFHNLHLPDGRETIPGHPYYRKKRTEDFIRTAALVVAEYPDARFIVVGGPDAFMPEYETELRLLACELRLTERLRFLGDRPAVPRLLAASDIFVWLSEGEGMPHVILEAGAVGLPVVATLDHGSAQQITDSQTGLFMPHQDPGSVAAALCRLIADPGLRTKLGAALREEVKRAYAAKPLTRRWEQRFDEIIADGVRLPSLGGERGCSDEIPCPPSVAIR